MVIDSLIRMSTIWTLHVDIILTDEARTAKEKKLRDCSWQIHDEKIEKTSAGVFGSGKTDYLHASHLAEAKPLGLRVPRRCLNPPLLRFRSTKL